MLKAFFRTKYPQAIWGEKIYRLIKKHAIDKSIENVYDVPCGAGFISYILHQKIKKTYYLIDIDGKKIEFAARLFSDSDVLCKTGNVHDEKFEANSLWLLINSLYLLDNVQDVLSTQSQNIKYVIGVFPYIDKRNYRIFKEKIDATLNVNEMDRNQTIRFFDKYGFELVDSTDSIHFNYLAYTQNRYINLLLSPLLFLLEKLFSPDGGVYWIGLFKNNK